MGRGAPFDTVWDELHNDDDFDGSDDNYSYLDMISEDDDYDLLDATDDIDDGTWLQSDYTAAAAAAAKEEDLTQLPITSTKQNEQRSAKRREKDRLRPKRNPKGFRFLGWTHPKEFNYWAQSLDDDKADSAHNNNNDDGNNNNNNNNNNKDDEYRAWWRNNSRCFEVDYICHQPHSNQWEYMTSTTTTFSNNPHSKQQQRIFQPTMELKPSAFKYDGGRYNAELRIGIMVHSPLDKRRINGGNFPMEKCQLSTTKIHIVLQSVFNDMVGEYYSRSLLGLHQTMIQDDTQTATSITTNNSKPWEEDIQFYIHIPLRGKQLLDGHKLLTAGMLANPDAGVTKSFLDLFPESNDDDDATTNVVEEDDDDTTTANVDNDECQCYRKMIFCGYDVYTTVEEYNEKKRHRDDEDEEEEVTDETNDTNDDTNDDEGVEKRINDGLAPSFNPNLKYTLWSAGTTGTYQGKDDSSPPGPNCIKGKKCQGYANLRNLMSLNFVKHYPNMNNDVVKFRIEALVENNLINDDYSGDTKEWLVVGLTQRTYRRAWLNLPVVMKEGNSKLNGRNVVFIEVNVEDTTSPYEQLILHRSLDVMIGVHGAQLTQAVVLPPHAHVLELLPWVPSYIRGHWVTRRNAPTPLGIIYHNTDLNHAGFSLNRSSTDLCVGVGDVGSEDEKECFLKQRKIFIWDNRDFSVEPEVVIQYVENLVLFMRDDEMGKLCSEVTDRLDERFVLYNVWCREGEETPLSVKHYYQSNPPPNEDVKYGLGKRERKKISA